MRAKVGERPEDFAKYEQNQGGNTVVTALEKIKNDVNKSMEDAIAQETSETKAYGNTVQTMNDQLVTMNNQKAQMNQELVEQKRTHQEESESRDAHAAELETDEEALKGKKKSCNFIMENLDIR